MVTDQGRVVILDFGIISDAAQIERWGILIRSEERLVKGRYALTERQVDAILELRLYQLTGLEIDKVEKEYNELTERIKDLLTEKPGLVRLGCGAERLRRSARLAGKRFDDHAGGHLLFDGLEGVESGLVLVLGHGVRDRASGK